MSTRAHILLIVAAGISVGYIFWLLRQHQLRSKYALLWLGIGIVLVPLAVFPGVLNTVADWLGVAYPPAAFLFLAVGFLFFVVVHFSWGSPGSSGACARSPKRSPCSGPREGQGLASLPMSTPKADTRDRSPRWVALITAVGLVGRVAYVLFVTRHYTVWGDAYFYHESSNLIADGKGFINPIDWIENHVRIQAADHPPLYLIYLAGWSLIGVTSTTGHMLVSVLLGAATIAVTAYAGKEIAGPRVGLIAAALVAIYPNVWAPDGMLLSETMAILTVSLTMLLVYRFWHHPSLARAAWMGVAVGLAALYGPS